MGTAVLHPRDCLAPSRQSRSNQRFYNVPIVSDCTMALRSVSAAAAADYVQERVLCGSSYSSRITEESRTATGGRLQGPIKEYPSSSSGLLPLPPDLVTVVPAALRSANLVYPSSALHRSASKSSSLPHLSHKAHRMLPSTLSSDITPMHRCALMSTPQNVFPPQNQQKLMLVDSHFGRGNAKHPCKYGASAQPQSTYSARCSAVVYRRHGGGYKQPPSRGSASHEKIKESKITRECDSQRQYIRDQSRRKMLAAADASSHVPSALAAESVSPVKKGSSTASMNKYTKSGWSFSAEEILGCLNSVSDCMSCNWLAMVDDQRYWAGPSFFNSPPPSSLPVPSFTLKLARSLSTCSSCPSSPKDVDSAAAPQDHQQEPDLLEAKLAWDVAFATKDLRRLLHLDPAV